MTDMTPTQISQAEVSLLRWVEKIGTPLIIAGFIGMAGFLSHVSSTMAELKSEHGNYNQNNVSVTAVLHKVEDKIDEQNKTQKATDINVQKVITQQENFRSQIEDMKVQNQEIIRLLRRYPRED